MAQTPPAASEPITISQAANLVGAVARETVYRWYTRGVAGVKLQARPIGGRIFTTREAIEQFLREVEQQQALRRVPTHREAEDELEAEGL